MTFISLPLMYHNLDFNIKLAYYLKQNNFSKLPIQVNSFFGSFPFSIFNGGLNLNIQNDTFLLNEDIDKILNNKNDITPFRFDCSNILLSDNDLQNIYQNIILEYGHNSGNFIEVSDFRMLNYLQEKFPNYEFIFSKNSNLINPLTPEIINTILEQNIFYLLELPNNFKKNLEFLNKIIKKDKIEITIGNKCTCLNSLNCELKEQEYIVDFSNNTNFYNCKKLNNYTNNNQLLEEINFYKNLGFNHFKIDTPPLVQNQQFKYFLIHNLIKEEYQLQFLNKG